MTINVHALIGIIILAIIVYVVIVYVRGKSSIQDMAPTELDISKPKAVMNSSAAKDILLTRAGSSVMGFFNVRLGDRTERMGIDNFITLFGVEGSFQFQISSSTARLLVRTGGTTSEMELIELPNLPLQKWVFIAVLRDGRRFDVMYGERIVASHRLNLFPSTPSNPLLVGSPAVLGSAIHILVAPYRLTPTEVVHQRDMLADTNGAPVAGTGTGAGGRGFGLPPIPFTGIKEACLPGLPCNPVTKPPKNHLKAWATPYN